MSKDVIGEALLGYYNNKDVTNIEVQSSVSEDDIIPTPYLFRRFKNMPELEQKALQLCKGKVLDIGAAGGCHSLELNKRGVDVEAIDVSEGAVQVMKAQGIKAQVIDFYAIKKQYDTLLFLMNGVGIAGTLNDLPQFLTKAKSLLNTGGQILLDSSDIKYLYEEEDGSFWMDLNTLYYGEVSYQMAYKDSKTDSFNWLFVDFQKLTEVAGGCGLKCELIKEGANFDYLARLTTA